MTHVVHTETVKDLTVKIMHDDDAENPFTSWGCEPDIIGWHRRYDYNTRKEDKAKTPEEFRAEAKANGYIVLPLYMYDHSGIAFSTSRGYPFNCPWDSGQYGFIFWTKEKIASGQGKEYASRITKKRREQLVNQLENAVTLLNDYVSGNVYGYVVEDEDGEHIDSCWGFYGDFKESDCLAQGIAQAEYHIEEREKAKAENDRNVGLTLGVVAA